MTRLPRLKGKELIRILETAGFRVARTKGSHNFLKHPDGEQQSCRCILVKRLGPGFCVRFCAT